MTVDIDKLKALALAYLDANRGYWYGTHELADGTTYEPGVDFIIECNPAAVLELIAEVERLRARFEYIEENATTVGGGNGFTVSFFVPVDHEDIGCGIDAAIGGKQ